MTTSQLTTSQIVNRSVINAILDNAGDTIMNITFAKKDGTLRDMQCRRGVTKGLKGVGSTYGAQAKAKYLQLFDMAKGEFRAVNRDTIERIALRGNVYEIQRQD